jgi:hypothetical protein
MRSFALAQRPVSREGVVSRWLLHSTRLCSGNGVMRGSTRVTATTTLIVFGGSLCSWICAGGLIIARDPIGHAAAVAVFEFQPQVIWS